MSRPAHILLVDDELSIQRTMVPLLRSRGYEVTVAGNAREALASVEGERPDLIVLDEGHRIKNMQGKQPYPIALTLTPRRAPQELPRRPVFPRAWNLRVATMSMWKLVPQPPREGGLTFDTGRYQLTPGCAPAADDAAPGGALPLPTVTAMYCLPSGPR